MLANLIKLKLVVDQSSPLFYNDGHELLAREWEVEEDRPPIYDTNVVEELPLLCDLYDDEDENPIFDIYVDDYDPPCDLLVLGMPPMEAADKAAVEVPTLAIKVITVATKATIAVLSHDIGASSLSKEHRMRDEGGHFASMEDPYKPWAATLASSRLGAMSSSP